MAWTEVCPASPGIVAGTSQRSQVGGIIARDVADPGSEAVGIAQRVGVVFEPIPLGREGQRAALRQRLRVLPDHAIGGAKAPVVEPEFLQLGRERNDIAIGETVRHPDGASERRLIEGAAVEIVAPIAEYRCEDPFLATDRDDARDTGGELVELIRLRDCARPQATRAQKTEQRDRDGVQIGGGVDVVVIADPGIDEAADVGPPPAI